MGRAFTGRVLVSVCEAETSQDSTYCSRGDIPMEIVMRDSKDSGQLDSYTPP